MLKEAKKENKGTKGRKMGALTAEERQSAHVGHIRNSTSAIFRYASRIMRSRHDALRYAESTDSANGLRNGFSGKSIIARAKKFR